MKKNELTKREGVKHTIDMHGIADANYEKSHIDAFSIKFLISQGLLLAYFQVFWEFVLALV